jgi:hypothetical protein
MVDEVEADATDSETVHLVEVFVLVGLIDHGHPGESALTTLHGIEHRPVVGPMT